MRGDDPREVAPEQERERLLEVQVELDRVVLERRIVVIIDVRHEPVGEARAAQQASVGPDLAVSASPTG